jgi:hypothetical protein
MASKTKAPSANEGARQVSPTNGSFALHQKNAEQQKFNAT